jgi:FkbM family methyltransferase
MFTAITAHARRISYHLGRRVTLGDHRFKVRGYHASRLSTSPRHEMFLLTVLQRQLLKPGAFLDVGVNVGQTLMKVLSIDAQRRYVGFEPQIGCCYFVEQFIRLNRLGSASVLPIALSDANGTMTLYSRGEYDEMASLTGDRDVTGAARPDATYVPTRIGDEVLRELGIDQISVIKIDVEGNELPVLRGLLETLKAKRPSVIFEVLPNFYGHAHERIMQPPDVRAKNAEAADGIRALFDAIGYEMFQIDDAGGETKISRFDLDDRDRFIGINYIAHPRSAI